MAPSTWSSVNRWENAVGRRAVLKGAIADRLRPTVMDAARRSAGIRVQRALGFWVVWHYWGGLDSMIESGLWSRSGVYKQAADFRALFGVEVSEAWPEAVAGLVHIDGYQGPATKVRAGDG
jgi:hypothetical protein